MKSIKGAVFGAMVAACVLAFGIASVGCSPSQNMANTGKGTDATPTAVAVDGGKCAWQTGFTKDDEGMVTVGDQQVDVRTMCMECHADSDSALSFNWTTIVESTADWKGESGMNPHESHLGAVQCDSCHMEGHSQVMYCNNCHSMEL